MKVTNEEKWNAVRTDDAAYDGSFFYAVKTTGIYCRPSCASRLPNPDHVTYFDTAAEAEHAGFRPCKRCRPDLIGYQPVRELADKMRQIIGDGFLDKAHVFEELKKLGVTPKRAIQVFKEYFGTTPGEHLDRLRIAEAVRQLRETDMPVIEIAFALGFESLTAFYTFFGKYKGVTPAAFRKSAGETIGTDAFFIYPSTLGKVLITADREAVTGIRFAGEADALPGGAGNALTLMAAEQLAEYFAGKRTSFTVPLRPKGSDFQRLVWSALADIPYGQTRSYRQVAGLIGRPSASRAVGMANNKNPILIMIPCHRVVGSDGSLTGYAAGLSSSKSCWSWRKGTGRDVLQGAADDHKARRAASLAFINASTQSSTSSLPVL